MSYRAAFWLFLGFALPAFLQTTTGCGFEAGSYCGEACVETESSPNSYMCSCDCGPEQLARAIRVEDPTDDAEEVVGGTDAGNIQLDSTDLDLYSGRVLGVRFRNVDIPAGATILSAKIQFGAHSNSGAGTGNVTMTIYGEDAPASSAAFTSTPLDLSSRTLTTESVSWPIPNWLANEVGANQLTPELAPILQEIVGDPAWGAGHAVSFLFYHASGAASAIRRAYSVESRADRAPLLVVEYEDPNSPLAKQTLRVCMLPTDVPPDVNTSPDLDALAADCTGRVQPTLHGIAEECMYPPQCVCEVVVADPKYSASCDGDCTEVPLDLNEGTECSNFDPIAGNTEATNAPGGTPVCLANSPLAYGLFGRRTTCEIDGTASSVTLDIEDESATPAARGVVNFLGYCPGGSCDVRMEYDLEIDDVTVGNFWGSETFRELASVGKTVEPAVLSSAGDGTFAASSTETSSRGRRSDDQRALFSTNTAAIDITALFGAEIPTCSVAGAVVGGVDPETGRCEDAGPSAGILCVTDDDCADDVECSDEVCNCLPVASADMTLTLNLTGNIVNQPPTAVVTDQTLECDIPGGARVDLDGSGSGDADDNIAFYSWLLGGRAGPLVGFDPISRVEQSVGPQDYVLRVIDDLGQTDEAVSEVTVEDTTPPEIFCNADPTVTPPQFPISYTATAEDVCDPDLTPEVVAYDCFQIGKKGKKIDKTSSCKVTFEGDTVTIKHSGGVDTIITWDVVVEDEYGNATPKTCQVLTVKKPA